MKFSVLMSLYAKEQPTYLRDSLNSLVAQTQQADEIIIVYDGIITPELDQIVQSYQSQLPIKIYKLPENQGLGKALNYGLNQCTHDWIFRMDTDDIALPDRFAQQCHYLQQHPQITLLGGQIQEFQDHPQPNHNSRQVPQTQAEIQQFAKKRNPFNHMTVAYQKAAVQKAGSYQHHHYMEDYNLWLRMLAQGENVANLAQTLVYARTGKAMLSRRRGLTYIKSEWQLSKLKRQLSIQSPQAATLTFLLRSLPRLLPSPLLRHIYQSLRHPTQKDKP